MGEEGLDASLEVLAGGGDSFGLNGFLLWWIEIEIEPEELAVEGRRGVEEAQVEHFTMGVGGRGDSEA